MNLGDKYSMLTSMRFCHWSRHDQFYAQRKLGQVCILIAVSEDLRSSQSTVFILRVYTGKSAHLHHGLSILIILGLTLSLYMANTGVGTILLRMYHLVRLASSNLSAICQPVLHSEDIKFQGTMSWLFCSHGSRELFSCTQSPRNIACCPFREWLIDILQSHGRLH